MDGKRSLHEAAVSSNVRCPRHSEQTMSLFCYSCDQLICRDCTLVGHVGHMFEILPKCAPRARNIWAS